MEKMFILLKVISGAGSSVLLGVSNIHGDVVARDL